MEGIFKIWWRGVCIGEFEVTGVDSWYLDGHWHSSSIAEAAAFGDLVSRFDPREVMAKPQNGTRAILKADDSLSAINVLVIGFQENTLIVRQCFMLRLFNGSSTTYGDICYPGQVAFTLHGNLSSGKC